MSEAEKHPPVLLIGTEGEWAGRSFESVLAANGYKVLRAEDGRDALMWATRVKPDAILLDEHLAGVHGGGIEVCRRLREDPEFDVATPIVLIASAPSNRSVRTEALRAGAWLVCTQPLDTETLFLELGTFIRARRVVSDARAQALVDSATGLLTPLGLQRWAEQLAARAKRNHESLACVVLMPATSGSDVPASSRETMQEFLEIARDVFRRSDIVGFLADGRLALLAPDTDTEGVHGFLARLRAAVTEAQKSKADAGETGATFNAGYWAIDDFATVKMDPAELLRRATEAFDQMNRSRPWSFQPGFGRIPTS